MHALFPIRKRYICKSRPHMNQPKLYIIAGCNGAGKTTASYTILPEIFGCREFVNADEIAHGLSPLRPEKVAIDAGRIMLRRIDKLLKAGETFAIETTLATRSYFSLIRRARLPGLHSGADICVAVQRGSCTRACCQTRCRRWPRHSLACGGTSLPNGAQKPLRAIYSRCRPMDHSRQFRRPPRACGGL